MAYFGRFTHLLLNEENVIRHLFCIVQRKARREILGECNDLWSFLICGCSCFLCASTGRTGDSWAGKDHSSIWFAASCSFFLTHRGMGRFGGLSWSIWVLQERQGHPWTFEELFWGCKVPISTGQKKQWDTVFPTDQVKPRGLKDECLRNIKQVSVFLKKSLEIYSQKGMEDTSPCILSITVYAQFPHRREWDGGGRHWWTRGRP